MICVFLCAGYATRMYPLTENFPKPLLKIKGKAILDYLIDDLISVDEITEFIVVSNKKFFKFFEDWKNGRKEKLTILDDGSTTNENRLGAVKDLEFAINSLNLKDDVMVLAGDNLLDFSLKEFISFARRKKSTAIMVYKEDDFEKLRRTGVAEIDDSGRVLSFEEKPRDPKSNSAVPPFYYFRKEDIDFIFSAIKAGCKTDSPGMLLEWLSKKIQIYAWEMIGQRLDIGNLEIYNKLNKN